MDDLISSPERRTRRMPGGLPRSITAIAVALGLTLGAAGIAAAASPSPAPSAQSSAAAEDKQERMDRKLGHRGDKVRGDKHGGPRGMGRALHGEAVVADGKDGFRTVAFQRGEVTEVSATAITVKSADNFIRTYALTATTKVNRGRAAVGDIKTGHRVAVLAVVVDETATAQGIRDEALPPAKKR